MGTGCDGEEMVNLIRVGEAQLNLQRQHCVVGMSTTRRLLCREGWGYGKCVPPGDVTGGYCSDVIWKAHVKEVAFRGFI